MRRTLVTVCVAALTLVTLVSPASARSSAARSLTARNDPHDTHTVPDIRTVWTDDSGSSVYVRIRAWEPLHRNQVGYRVVMDTGGSNLPDRLIEIVNSQQCIVWTVDPDRSFGDIVGQRPWHRPDRRDVACRLPRGWFDITTRVSFAVYSGAGGDSRSNDRAPNDGRFVGL